MRPLFIAGCARSGTTALADYLNLHPEILMCIERYKYLPPENIRPKLFTLDRILDYKKGETNIPRERHVDLVQSKDLGALKWIGDKKPAYYREFRTILENNPGAHFIVIHRPVEEVAESFEKRAMKASDGWPDWAGFDVGVERWNQATGYIREFMESGLEPDVLILDYHEFFSHPESYTPLLSEFLEVEFDEPLLENWRKISSGFEGRRRTKEPPSEEQQEFVRKHKDIEAERWILDVIERQKSGPVKLPRSEQVTRNVHEEQIQYLERRLVQERRKSQQIRKRNKRLKSQSQTPDGQASHLLETLTRFKERLIGK
jgi:hypothetical protein